ncbi:MAG: CHAP domain-containing protein [Lactobacillales bacterium]|nr:CHAP domain-containing protein [Lactobacillales bacterium]
MILKINVTKVLMILFAGSLAMVPFGYEEVRANQESKLLNLKLDFKIFSVQKGGNDDLKRSKGILKFSLQEVGMSEFLLENKELIKKPDNKHILESQKVEDSPSVVPEVSIPVSIGNYGEGNTYVPGQCTWYVKDYFKKRVGDYWGNAISWGESALMDGLLVDQNPVADSTVAVFGANSYNEGYGHVAVVIGVKEGFVRISEMNCRGPWSMGEREIPIASVMSFIHV